MNKPRKKSPEWLIWENFVSEFPSDVQAELKRECVEYFDHTDNALAVSCKKPSNGFDSHDRYHSQEFRGLIVNHVYEVNSAFTDGVYFLEPCTEQQWILDSKFYEGRKWRACRYATLLQQGNWCRACGGRPPNVELHVDHVVPRSIDPSKAWDLSNLQVLCKDCNLGKGNGDTKDWRISPEKLA